MTQKQLEDYLWGAANILRGMIDAADFKQYIFPLLFFKRISDLWDEEYQVAIDESGGDLNYAYFAENHRFQIPEGCHWEDVRKKTIDVGAALQNALTEIEKANFEMLHDVFGDAQWTNKRRMSDEKMLDLIEHFSQMKLSVAEVPHDIMGNGYEYLIKKFADDSGHTAAEFYTNRTVVKLMTQITDPQPDESIYDPTCGSGGILLNSVLHVKAQEKEFRTLKLYGQELNLITSAIARINMFMHNVDEFLIVQGDTLDSPQILEDDELKQFDVIMANPPYSVKKWNREKWMSDPFGRNIWGTPPQGCADYAFQQHIMKSLNEETGRCVVLWPHGVLFRDVESDIRKKMIEKDYVDAVIGLGKNLFYNSSMESCLLVCRMKKPDERKNNIIFIDAKEELRIERTNAWLEPKHIKKISEAYWKFKDADGFAKVMTNHEVLENNGNLSLQLYVKQATHGDEHKTDELITSIKLSQHEINSSLDNLFSQLKKDRYIIMILSKEKWKTVRLDEICDVRDGTHESPKYHQVGFPLITSKNITGGFIDFSSTNLISEEDYNQINKRSFVDDGDILLSMIGTVGIPVLVEKKFDFAIKNVGLLKFTKQKPILNKFLLNVLQSDIFQNKIKAVTSGTAQKFISLGLIRTLQIPLPPLEEQNQIAELLRSIETSNEQVEGQQKNLKNLLNSLVNGLLKEEPEFGKLLNHKNCKLTKFGSIIDCIEQHDKQKKELKRFIGLEDIEPGNLIIETWGDIEKGTTFTKRFIKGDVLFGKRRAYLKKVAVPDFDGICSGDILVFRAKKETILPDLLPIYVASELFIKHAVKTSAGSLSPRTKWKDLRDFELSLPDLNTQETILKVLLILQNANHLLKEQKVTLKNLKQKLLNEILG